MTVKADSKGRLTGAQPGARYERHKDPDGRIVFTPEQPVSFSHVRDVTYEEFEQFFGAKPGEVLAEPGIRTCIVSESGFMGQGIRFQRLNLDENGKPAFDANGNIALTDCLIRFKKEEM